MEKDTEKMKNLIEKIKSESSTSNVSQNADGALEFQFDAPIAKTGLVFEESEDAEAPDEEDISFDIPDCTGNAFNVLTEAPEEITESATKEEESESAFRDVNDEEFIIPDVFEIAEASERNANPSDDYVSTIWKAYVPRFTEVTNDPYHFSEKKNDVNSVEDNSVDLDTDGAVASFGKASQIKVSVRSTGVDRTDINDPTAEIETVVPEAVVVNINGKKTVSGDTINVFKFSDKKNEEEVVDNISDEELERREISGLTGHKWEEKIPEEEASASEETPVLEESFDEKEKTVSYFSDYEDRPLPEMVKIGPKIVPEKLPEGYEKDSRSQASDTSEYNSFSTRDSFKDKFLDSIMAVKIRFIVAILLGIATIVFDIFEKRICAYFGFGMNFSAPAVIDACFIASIFLITLPETCRAFKNLIFGVVTPELLSAIVGISIFAYACAMASIAPIAYPLFASVYVITAVNSIFATLCLHSANFSAFKVISEKGNKSVLDKSLTRNLELENMALDGVIDESKSRCARVFTTPFVSGFFRNSSKNSEKTKNNLLILALGFGVALVMGAVMFFVKGPVSALSSFALVVSLSVPAFSILCHKLSYYDAQREVALDNSAIVGERALLDYSAVDVVTFEDTEVFGPDDVTLKSASDRRSDYIDTMRKMSSLFAALGGPLQRVFENALNKKYSPAENVVIEDDGAEGYVEGERVMAGTAEYMKRHEIRIPSSGDIKVGSTRVIYAASDGEFFATFTVHYSFSEEFALLLSAMRERGVVPLVYTRDFNINNDFMRMLTGGSDIIRVMKKYTPVEEPKVYSKINSAMVTTGEKTAAINLILSAKRYAHFQSLAAVMELSAAAVGAALAVVITLCNMTASLPTAILSVWQLGWSVALAIASRRTFNIRKKDRKNAE